MRVAVIGHVECVEFVRVESVPRPGDIVHALETWDEAAGGGAVAAVQLARLAGACTLFTSFGADELGRRARLQLAEQGVTVRAMADPSPQRRAVVFVDDGGERTITVLGDKLVPSGGDSRLPWQELEDADAAFFVSGDAESVHAARRARILVATSRELRTLRAAAVELDVLVGSGEDEGEVYHAGDLDPPPRIVVTTSGPLGGWVQPGGPFRPASLPVGSRPIRTSPQESRPVPGTRRRRWSHGRPELARTGHVRCLAPDLSGGDRWRGRVDSGGMWFKVG